MARPDPRIVTGSGGGVRWVTLNGNLSGPWTTGKNEARPVRPAITWDWLGPSFADGAAGCMLALQLNHATIPRANLVHLVFSTKNREGWLLREIRDGLHGYVGGIVENLDGILLKAGSVADHVHLLIAHPRTCSPSEMVREIKTGSSKWLKTQVTPSFIGKVDMGFFPSVRCIGRLSRTI